MAREGASNLPEDNAAGESKTAAEYRAELVASLKQGGVLATPQLEAAFATVPRENFLPSELPLNKVYSDDAIVVKYSQEGLATSSSSQPFLMADMLTALNLEPGMKVLEIGAGVGYNAAIMASVVGDGRLVTSLDLDPEMVKIAQDNLIRLGPPYSEVQVIAVDGAEGHATNAPYDRIIVTVQQWEISPAWVEQLKVGGILLLPLTVSTHVWGGLIPAMRKEADGTLHTVAASSGGFMPMRGRLAHPYANRSPYSSNSLIPTMLAANEILPPHYQAEKALIYLTSEGLPEANSADFLNSVEASYFMNGLLERPSFYPPDLTKTTEQEKALIGLAQGFNMLLAATLEDRLCNLLVATPSGSSANTSNSNGFVREGWRYEWRGIALVVPTEDQQALDIAILIGTEAVQGWRVGDSPQVENLALQKITQLWHIWQNLGRPNPADYRPLAYPATQPAPCGGVIIKRQHFNLVLPL